MNVEVVIPWAGGCPYRDRALAWVRDRLDHPVRLAQAPEGPWSKGRTLWPAVAESSADLIVMHDADVWTDGLAEAIAAVEDGEPWAMPHERVRRLTAAASDQYMAGADLEGLSYQERYKGVWGGGIVVLPRDTYLRVPIDPRFTGWGQEDYSWANALWFLAGEGWRGNAELVHLWHPPSSRLTRDRGSVESVELAGRYRRARFPAGAMQNLVNEALEELEGADVASHAA